MPINRLEQFVLRRRKDSFLTPLTSIFVLFAALLLSACVPASQQRGLLASAYVSTSRPAISIQTTQLPLLTSGQNKIFLDRSGVIGGLPVDIWLTAYGNIQEKKLAVVAHSEVPEGWMWDADMRHLFSRDEALEVIGGIGFQACTYVALSKRNPFNLLLEQEDTATTRWLVRSFAQRFNFNADKIILEYREVLPEAIVDIRALPLGYGDYLAHFEQRAREAFIVADLPSEHTAIQRTSTETIKWQYINSDFLGTVSRYGYFRPH